MATALVSSPTSFLTATTTPTLGQMYAWWEAMWADPTDLRTAFADGFPHELEEFLTLLRQDERPFWLLTDGPKPLAAFWLHDLVYDDTGTLSGGWLGGHIISSARKPYSAALSELSRRTLQASGLRHIFAAVNKQNRRSQAYVTRGLRFTRVTSYAAFTLFGGQQTEVVIYSRGIDDHELARQEAQKRAMRNKAAWDPMAVLPA